MSEQTSSDAKTVLKDVLYRAALGHDPIQNPSIMTLTIGLSAA
jgi:hypothetical protein